MTTIGNPYVGPRTFTGQEAHLFFGREREARELLALVISQRLVLFYAQSGAGKSSLVNTRLIPCLREAGFAVLPVGRVRGELPTGLDSVDNIFLFNLMASLDQDKEGRESDPACFAHLDLTTFLARLTSDDGEIWYYDEQAEAPRTELGADAGENDAPYVEPNSVLVIDQFEEIITSHPDRWDDRAAFFATLDAAMRANPRLWVVLVLREEYVATLDLYAPLMQDHLRARYYMQRMGMEAALEAIRKPAELGGRPFDSGVAEILVNSLRRVKIMGQPRDQLGQYVEPVQLQVVCYQLWEALKDRPLRPITEVDLKVAGDVDNALAAFYELAVIHALTAANVKVAERQLRNWFDTRLITEMGTRGVVFLGEKQAGSMPTAVVRLLQEQYLLRSEPRAGGVWAELTHDRLIEPIQRSNQVWYTKQRRRWLQIGVGVVACLVLLLAVVSVRVIETTTMTAAATSTAAAIEIQKASATAAVEAQVSDYLNKGLSYEQQGKYTEAIYVYDEAIKLDPTNAEVYFSRGKAHANFGAYNNAIADYTSAIELAYDPLTLPYLARGNAYLDRKEYAKALVDYTKVIELDPTNADAYYNRTLVYSDLGEDTQANADYVKAMALNPEAGNPYNNRGLYYYSQGEYSKAIVDYTRAIELDPAFASVCYYNRGNAYYEWSRYKQAIADYTEAIELKYEPLSWPYHARGNAYSGLGTYNKAIADYTEAIELSPDDSNTYYVRGLAYSSLGDYNQAIANYTEAIERDPQNVTLYYERGYAYYVQQGHPQAIADFAKAIELKYEPLSWPYLARGDAYNAQGKYEQAIADYTEAVELDPEDANTYYNRGLAYSNLGQTDVGAYEKAIADFNQAIELEYEPLSWPYNARGNAYAAQGKYKAAIDDYTKAIELKYDPPSWSYISRGHAYAEWEKYEQAFIDFNTAIELDPKNAEAYNELCWWGSLTNQAATVVDGACEEAVKWAPPTDIDNYRDSRGVARALTGDYEGALEDFRAYVEWGKRNRIPDELLDKRLEWIRQLKLGQNPFDEETLKALRHE